MMKKIDKNKTELKAVYQYLTRFEATASMISVALDIWRPNVCRYKRMLEEEGKLIIVYRGRCQVTGRKADYLSSDPNVISFAKRKESIK